MKRDDPPRWPPTWKTPEGWMTDSLGTAQSAVIVNALRLVKACKKTKTEPDEMSDLRMAARAVDACFREPALPFPPTYVRVLGIDPGLAHLGLMAVDFTTEFIRLVHREHFVTSTEQGSEEERLGLVAGKLHSVFALYRPDVVAYENILNVGHQKGETSSAAARVLEVTGMIRMCCQTFACRPCYAVATNTARKALFGHTPRGTTRSKLDVKNKLRELLGIRGTVSENVTDAGAVAFGGFALHMEAIKDVNRTVG